MEQAEKVKAVAYEVSAATPRKIFIHAINFPPELIGCGRYTGQFAQYLADSGEAVEVVTAVPHYPGWYTRAPYKNGRYYREHKDKISIWRCPLVLNRSGRGFWRLIAPLSFAIAAAPLVFWRILRSRPDVVICVEPTLFSAPVAAFAAKLVGARRVLYVQDLEIDAAFGVGHLNNRILKSIAGAFEKFTLQRFKSIVTISQQMAQLLVKKGISPNHIILARNWVDVTRLKHLSGPNAFRQELNIDENDFVVLYSGQIGPKQGLHHLLESAQMCSGEQRIHFVIVGDGPTKAALREKYGALPNVHFLPLQPEDRLCELLNLPNLHILPQERGVADLVLPSKLGGMLASERAILVTAEPMTELYDLLNGKAIIVPPSDSSALTAAILQANITRPRAPAEATTLVTAFASDTVLSALRRQILQTE